MACHAACSYPRISPPRAPRRRIRAGPAALRKQRECGCVSGTDDAEVAPVQGVAVVDDAAWVLLDEEVAVGVVDVAHLVPFAEEAATQVSLLVWLAIGAVAVAPAASGLTWQVAAYGVLSLTLVRMAPVVGGARSGTRRRTRAACQAVPLTRLRWLIPSVSGNEQIVTQPLRGGGSCVAGLLTQVSRCS